MRRSLRSFRLQAVRLVVPVVLLLARPDVEFLLAGAPFALLGAALRAWAAGTIRKNRVLTVVGPYAHLRHPLYAGSFLIGLGIVIGAGAHVYI
jgi:protein-S-isoprenylcysteine O-methyltransferase Ste14